MAKIHYFWNGERKKSEKSQYGTCDWREMFTFAVEIKAITMSYSEMAQLELMNALNSISSEAELNEFKDLVARYFAAKAQKAIDALWDEGVINDETIEQWGAEHMRTPSLRIAR